MQGFCFKCGVLFLSDDNGPTLCPGCLPAVTWGVNGDHEQPKYVERDHDVMAPFTVLVDTREQRAYTMTAIDELHRKRTVPLHVPLKVCTIPAGDYSIDGYADQVAVERKTLADFLQSFGGNRDAEERKLAKLATMPVAWYMLEFTYRDLLLKHMPHSLVSRKALSRSIMSYQVKFTGVHWFFADCREVAESLTYRLLEKWWWDRIGKPMEEATKKLKAKGRA